MTDWNINKSPLGKKQDGLEHVKPSSDEEQGNLEPNKPPSDEGGGKTKF